MALCWFPCVRKAFTIAATPALANVAGIKQQYGEDNGNFDLSIPVVLDWGFLVLLWSIWKSQFTVLGRSEYNSTNSTYYCHPVPHCFEISTPVRTGPLPPLVSSEYLSIRGLELTVSFQFLKPSCHPKTFGDVCAIVNNSSAVQIAWTRFAE